MRMVTGAAGTAVCCLAVAAAATPALAGPPPQVMGGLEVVQRADSAAMVQGGTVTYTVTATNRTAGVLKGVRLRDDLAKVLDDAVYQRDARASVGTVVFQEPVIWWSGDLNPGAAATITYSVVIKDPDTGDRVLESDITSEGGSGVSVERDPVRASLGYGDAPDSYHTTPKNNGPTEIVSNSLKLGTIASPDADAHAGVTSFPPLTAGTRSYALNVAVKNETGRPATLAGWIDLDGNGSFDKTERAVVEVPAGATTARLVWQGLRGVRARPTYLRLRLDQKPGRDQGRNQLDLLPYGPGGVGSVADYRIPVAGSEPALPARSLTLLKTVNRSQAQPGERILYRITVTNNTLNPISGVTLRDDLSQVLTNADFNGDATSGAVFNGGILQWRGTAWPQRPVIITYSVTMRGRGAGTLDSTVVSNNPGQNCWRGSPDLNCRARVVRHLHRAIGPFFPHRRFGCSFGADRCFPFHHFFHHFHHFHPFRHFHPLSHLNPFRRCRHRLPFTGATIEQSVLLALCLLAGGTAAVVLTRRRRPPGPK